MRLTTVMLALCAAGVASLPSLARAGQVESAFIPTPQPGGPPSAALSVNDAGEIYGRWRNFDATTGQATTVTGVMYPTWGIGQTIQNGFGSQNDLGQSVSGAYLSYGGNSVDLRPLFGASGMIFYANSLNNHGTIVGEMERGLSRQAFRIVLHPEWMGGNGSWSDTAKWSFGGLGAVGFKVGPEHDVLMAPTTASTILGAGSAQVRTLQIGGTGSSAVTLNLNGGDTATSKGTIIGAGGTVTGNGTLDGTLRIDAGGTVAARANESLSLGGAVSNSGTLRVTGTSTRYAVANTYDALHTTAEGRITLQSGVLIADQGQTLSGQLNVISGRNHVLGTVQVNDGGLINVASLANAAFYDVVDLQAGAELRVNMFGTATFYDHVYQRTGARITGMGTKNFIGGLSVGNSPGMATIDGDAQFGATNVYEAEIGGLTACTEACETDEALRHSSYDHLNVNNGVLTFGGKLTLTSWNGFVGQAGQTFDLFDATSFQGAFDQIDTTGFLMAANTRLDVSQLYTTGQISVTAVPEPELPALLLAGLGVIGLMARRKRTPAAA
ncbi:MAG: PEP-CTERM sorting domain-containing protein [Aquabacterium sp.]